MQLRRRHSKLKPNIASRDNLKQPVNRNSCTLDYSTKATRCQSSKPKTSTPSIHTNKTLNILKQSLYKKGSTSHLLGKLPALSRTQPEMQAEFRKFTFQSSFKRQLTFAWSRRPSKRTTSFVNCLTNIFQRISEIWMSSMLMQSIARHQVRKSSRQWPLLPSRTSWRINFSLTPQVLTTLSVRACCGKRVSQVRCQIWRIPALYTPRAIHQDLQSRWKSRRLLTKL